MIASSRSTAFSYAVCVGEGLLSALFFVAAQWAAPLGFPLGLVSPMPVAVASWRRGALGAVSAAMAALTVLWVLAGPGAAASYFVYFGAGGCVLGLALRNGRSPEAIVGGYALVSVVAFWATLVIEAAHAGASPLAVLASGIQQSATQVKELLLQANADAAASVDAWTGRFTRAFPGAMAAMCIFVGWVNGLALRRALVSRGVSLPPWNTWRARESWIWVLIASGLTALLAKGVWATVALNLFIPALAVYFLQGLAVVQYVFEARAFPRLLRGVTYVILFLQFPVMLLVAGLGAFDLWINFRSRWSLPTKGAQS